MKQALSLVLAVLFLCCLPGTLVAEHHEGEKHVAKDAQTLTGEFKWTRMDEPGDLKAVFTPTGEDAWDVSFYFTFRDEPHVYSGTAEGSLADGSTLKGEVMSDGEKPSPFSFEGKFVDGKFEGTHASLRDDEPKATGTLTLGH